MNATQGKYAVLKPPCNLASYFISCHFQVTQRKFPGCFKREGPAAFAPKFLEIRHLPREPAPWPLSSHRPVAPAPLPPAFLQAPPLEEATSRLPKATCESGWELEGRQGGSISSVISNRHLPTRAPSRRGKHHVPRAPPPAPCPPRTSQGSAREGPSPPKQGTVLLSHLPFLLLDFNSGPEGSQGLEVMI